MSHGGCLVLKFGGTSVGDAEAMRAAGTIVQNALPDAPLVVLSAMAGATSRLLDAARLAESGELRAARATIGSLLDAHLEAVDALLPPSDRAEPMGRIESLSADIDSLIRGIALLRELSPRSADAVAGFGELLSTTVFLGHLRSLGVEAELVDARRVIRTDAAFGRARPDTAAIEQLAASEIGPGLGVGRVVLTQGFIGSTPDGVGTTLGRGGSDYSAALLAAALGANEVQIWTDVEGVFTCDPRIVPGARHVAELGFAEAAELAAFGARVLHPATIQPAVRAGIPVTVRDTRRPGGRHTRIAAGVETRRAVTAIAYRRGVTVVTVTSTRMLDQPGFLERMFRVFGDHDVNVDVVATAEISVSLTVDGDAPLEPVLRDLRAFSTAHATPGRALVAIIGERLKRTPGIATRIFDALRDTNVEMISMANEVNLSLLIEEPELESAILRLHASLFEVDGGS